MGQHTGTGKQSSPRITSLLGRPAAVLASAASLALLVGCSGGSPADGETGQGAEGPLTVVLLQHWVPEANEYMQAALEAAGESIGVEVRVDLVAEADLQTRITSSMLNDSGPDIVMLRTSMPILYQDHLTDVSDLAEELIERHGEFFDANREQSSAGGRWTALPLYSSLAVPIVRTDLLDAAGVSIPATYDELLDAAMAIDGDEGVDGFGTGLSSSRDGALFVQAVLWAFGSETTAADGETVTLDSPETVAAVEYLADLYDSGAMPEGVTGWNDSANNQAYLAGQLGMTTNAPSLYYQLNSTDDPLAASTAIVPWPSGPAGNSPMVDSYGFSITDYSPRIEEAKDLLREIYSDEVLEGFYASGQGFQNATLQPFTELPVFADPGLAPVIEALAGARWPGWPGHANLNSAEVENQFVLTDMITDVLVGGLSPEESVRSAAGRVSEIYAD